MKIIKQVYNDGNEYEEEISCEEALQIACRTEEYDVIVREENKMVVKYYPEGVNTVITLITTDFQ